MIPAARPTVWRKAVQALALLALLGAGVALFLATRDPEGPGEVVGVHAPPAGTTSEAPPETAACSVAARYRWTPLPWKTPCVLFTNAHGGRDTDDERHSAARDLAYRLVAFGLQHRPAKSASSDGSRGRTRSAHTRSMHGCPARWQRRRTRANTSLYRLGSTVSWGRRIRVPHLRRTAMAAAWWPCWRSRVHSLIVRRRRGPLRRSILFAFYDLHLSRSSAITSAPRSPWRSRSCRWRIASAR